MDTQVWRKWISVVLLLGLSAPCIAQNAAHAPAETVRWVSGSRLAVTHETPDFIQQPVPLLAAPLPVAPDAASTPSDLDTTTQSFPGSEDRLTLWSFNANSSRDGNQHSGVIVGRNPFTESGTVKVPTYIVPLIVRTQSIATAFDTQTFVISTTPGDTIVDSSAADDVCLAAPNNIPTRLVRQSPLFEPARFVFGATDVGATQYLDAYQRASFWTTLGERAKGYHVLLEPVRTLEAVVINVPSDKGLAITDPQFFSAFGRVFCAPLQIIDLGWFDSYLRDTVIPALHRKGLEPSSLPIFVAYDAGWAPSVTEFATCCDSGYHSSITTPYSRQTYAVAEFNGTRLFGPGDTQVLSHEIAEWANDPFVDNSTPPWSLPGQVTGCQSNLEVGDPLSGHGLPPVTMPNGFTYHLQELAFFSWFFGAPSVGANGWYSNSGSFLTDAGPLCM